MVVVLSPFLTWSDLSASGTPSLWTAATGGAVANMNSITADPGWPTVAGGAAPLSSGRWAAGPIGAVADAQHLDAIEAANSGSLNPPDLGALGQAVHDGGGTTAAVGNSDEDTSTPAGTRRPAALVAMDSSGTVDLNLTSSGLLSADPGAPFGARADARQLRTAIRIALADNPSLLVIDPGDLERAHDASQTPERTARSHAEAVQALDGVVADVRRATSPDRTLLLVVTLATDKPYYEPPYFGPTIAAGADLVGELTSGSTHRPGLVTNLDVGPTVLSALGMRVPSTMIGQPITTPSNPSARPSAELGQRIDELARLGTTVGAVDYVRDLFFIRLFSWSVFWMALGVALIALVQLPPALRTVARLAVLLTLSLPAGAWLLFLVDRYPATPVRVAIAFGVATLVVFGIVVALSTALHSPPEVTLLALSTLTSLLICVDQWMGRPLESGLFSYSIRAGWRYYGMGNEGAALLVGASILAVGITCDLFADSRWAQPLRIGLMPVVGAVALMTSAASFAGANAGVAVWGVVAFGVAWARVNRIRLTWRTALGIVAAIVALVGALVAIDLARGSGETHLGRFFTQFATGDLLGAGDLIYRKALNNYNYLLQTPYSWLAAAIVGALAATRWLGARPLPAALAKRPGVSAALLGLLAGGVAAALTEDSGIVMPALMLFSGALPILYLALKSSDSKSTTEQERGIPGR